VHEPEVAPEMTERTSRPSVTGSLSLLTGRLITIERDLVLVEVVVVVVLAVFLSSVGSDLLGSVVDEDSVLVVGGVVGAAALGRVKYQTAKTTPVIRSAIKIMRLRLDFVFAMGF
jgi:hypothetical protein